MYNVKISPSLLKGRVSAPPSKSVAHRLLICAALSDGNSKITDLSSSKDIIATIEALKALGAEIEFDGTTANVKGIKKIPKKAVVDCNESGSTLRFIIPIAAALGVETIFVGKGKLPERPITPYLEELTKNGIAFDYNNTMPFSITGKLKSGNFSISGDISSQFITGLLFALPLLEGDSQIILTSKLESKPYVDITIDCLNKFGVEIIENEKGYYIKGSQKYISNDVRVEGDYSQAAFYYVANALGSDIQIDNLNPDSYQGDKKIIEIINEISYNKKKKAFEVDGSDIPDIVPILTVLACFCEGQSRIYNVSRLRIKESDRLESISSCINKIGGNVIATEDSLIINGVESFTGGEVDSFNDHRIAMSMAICATRCKDELIITNANAVEKSYPDFFEEYKKLGGKVNVINME